MKDLNFTLGAGDGPVYLKLAAFIRDSIKLKRLLPGERLPSSRELSKKLSLNRLTILEAYAELVSEGWVRSVQRSRYFVSDLLPSHFQTPKSNATVVLNVNSKFVINVKQVSQVKRYQAKDYDFSFPSGTPDMRRFPTKEFKSFLYDSLQTKENFLYSSIDGNGRLITQLDIFLRRYRGIVGREIVICNGSQEAIFIAAQLLLKQGDFVAVEELGYPPALEIFRSHGAQLLPIKIDKNGLDPVDLEKKIKNKNVKMIYLTPLHQYPTTVTLSITRRMKIYELAVKHKIPILEDDYDHEYHYTSQPLAPLASTDPYGVVIYVSTFSKILFPAARVGYLVLPEHLKAPAVNLKAIISRQNEGLIQDALARWMESGGFERHLRRMRRIYNERLEGLCYTLNEIKKQRPHFSFSVPDGGMAVWLNIGSNSSQFAKDAAKKRIFVLPESNFRLDGLAGTHIRIGFASQTTEENAKGLKKLFTI